MGEKSVSKSRFKPRALEYFRQVEETGTELVITDHGRPVLKIVPFSRGQNEVLAQLRNTVLKYDDPFSPIAPDDWEALR